MNYLLTNLRNKVSAKMMVSLTLSLIYWSRRYNSAAIAAPMIGPAMGIHA